MDIGEVIREVNRRIALIHPFEYKMPTQPGIGRATIPRWSQPWLYPARYKSAAGGRGAGRTHTFSELCVLRMDGKLPAYDPGPVTIAAARQFQNSISESCKKAMEFYIKKLGLSDRFVVRNYAIDNKLTGSHCFFPGFNRNPQSLMSAEGVDILWVEQAETLGDEMELIVPTIRAPGSELWFSWNPTERLQWCWQRFAVNPRPADVVVWCNYDDNPWFPDELEEERVRFQMGKPRPLSARMGRHPGRWRRRHTGLDVQRSASMCKGVGRGAGAALR